MAAPPRITRAPAWPNVRRAELDEAPCRNQRDTAHSPSCCRQLNAGDADDPRASQAERRRQPVQAEAEDSSTDARSRMSFVGLERDDVVDDPTMKMTAADARSTGTSLVRPTITTANADRLIAAAEERRHPRASIDPGLATQPTFEGHATAHANQRSDSSRARKNGPLSWTVSGKERDKAKRPSLRLPPLLLPCLVGCTEGRGGQGQAVDRSMLPCPCCGCLQRRAPRRIDSIPAQSFRISELVIVDDGSTDGSRAIVSLI